MTDLLRELGLSTANAIIDQLRKDLRTARAQRDEARAEAHELSHRVDILTAQHGDTQQQLVAIPHHSARPALHISRGLPASGKSTWARSLVDTYPPGSFVRLNRDDLRAMALPTGYRQPEPAAEEVITVVQQAAIVDLLRLGVDVIVDDTNLRTQRVEALIRLAVQTGADTVVNDSFLAVPVDECIRRDQQRKCPVGEDVIRGMHERYLSGPAPIR